MFRRSAERRGLAGGTGGGAVFELQSRTLLRFGRAGRGSLSLVEMEEPEMFELFESPELM